MASAVITSPRSLQSITIAESISNSEESPAKRIRSSRSVALATACAAVHPTVYRHLDKTKREIRICDLHSSSELSAPLICSLRIVSLDRVGKFVAFSYVWGQEPSTETITINGFQHQIRPNLATGLRRLRANYYQSSSGKRRKPRPISIWADAICINQDSIEERNHQVPFMRFIFSKCEYAFSWLGESDSTSDLAMDSIARLEAFKHAQSREHYIAGLEAFEHAQSREHYIARLEAFEHAQSRKHYYPHVLLTLGGSPFCEAAPWIAIRKLLEREFWHRVWIFQEIVLPKKLVLACGPKYISWTTFEVLNDLRVDIRYRRGDHRLLRRELAHLDVGTQDEVIAVCRIAQSFLNILEYRFTDPENNDIAMNVEDTAHLKASDPRDKVRYKSKHTPPTLTLDKENCIIYGLLGLEENPTILPDYSKTANQVYTEFATLMLRDDLTYLQYCGLSANGNDAKLASWVPNWDHITRTKTTAAVRWKALLDRGTMIGDCLEHLMHVEFHVLPHLQALHIRGQLRSSIISIKSQNEWLEVQNYKTTISNMYGSLYPCWSEDATDWKAVHQPVQRLVALYLTLTQRYCWFDESLFTEPMETAAGFCYTTISRLNGATDTTSTSSTPSLSILLETLASQFENQLETFSHPEQYENDYLAEENESLYRRMFFETSSGRFGLGPIGAQEGDIICNIYGFGIPLVLRKVDSHYLIIGTCFVLGCMADQGYDESKAEILEIW